MNRPDVPAAETTLTQDLIYAIRYYLSRRRVLIVLVAVLLGIGAALNWSWLVAMGIAPLLIAVAPCAVMCALGLCVHRNMGSSCSTDSNASHRSRPPARGEKSAMDGLEAVGPLRRSDGRERLPSPPHGQEQGPDWKPPRASSE